MVVGSWDLEDKENDMILPINNENSIPIVFSFNDEYSRYFSVALQSIIENSDKEKNYDIIVLETEISRKNKRILLENLPINFSLRFFNIEKYILKILGDIKLEKVKTWSVEMYYRIFIPIIMKKYKKVLYLDSDTICKTDISKMFEIDFEGKELLAVTDIFNMVSHVEECKLTRDYIIDYLKIENLEHYFNSGVLLFNINQINVNDYLKRMINAFQIEKTNFPDQDILNLIFKDRVKFISQKWNLQWHLPLFYKKDIPTINQKKLLEYNEYFENPFIIHYTSFKKPWEKNKEDLAFNFWRYAKKTDYYEELLMILCKQEIVNEKFAINLYSKLKENKKVVFWGASLFLEEFLRKYGFFRNVLGVIDKNRIAGSSFIHGYNIYSPSELKDLDVEEIIISIIHHQEKRYEEINQFLEENNLKHIKLTQI